MKMELKGFCWGVKEDDGTYKMVGTADPDGVVLSCDYKPDDEDLRLYNTLKEEYTGTIDVEKSGVLRFAAELTKQDILFFVKAIRSAYESYMIWHYDENWAAQALQDVLKRMPGYTLEQAAAKYDLGRHYTVMLLTALNIDEINLFDVSFKLDMDKVSLWFDENLEKAIANGYDTMLEAYYAGVPVEDIIA